MHFPSTGFLHEQAQGRGNYLLHSEQAEALQSIKDAREAGLTAGYLNMATGLGKTVIAAHDVADFREQYPGARGLYLSHTKEILRQGRGTFSEVLDTGVTHGNLYSGECDDKADMVYAAFQAMNSTEGEAKTYEYFDPEEFDYVVVDESHHGPAPTYREVIKHFQPRFMLGLTATPERRDQQDIKELFGAELYTELLEDAIAKGHVVKPDYRVLTDHVRRLEEIGSEIDTLTPKQLDNEIFVRRQDEEVVKIIAEHLAELEDPRTIVFCNTIEQTERVAELLSDVLPGAVTALHSKLHPDLQTARMKDFKRGVTDTLVVVDQLNEGVDVPDVNAVVFLRSTESRMVWLQQLGRGLRKIAGKESVRVLDFVASWQRIRDIQTLQSRVRDAYRQHEPLGVNTNIGRFDFEFSEEALRAVEVIQYARERKTRPKPIERKPRLEKWEQEEAELKTMLGVEKLPRQGLTSAEWQRYGERILAGQPGAAEELLQRHLRTIYGLAKKYHASSDNNESSVEDNFQVAVEGFYEGVHQYLSDTNPKRQLKHAAQWGLYGSLERSTTQGLIIKTALKQMINMYDRHHEAALHSLDTAAGDDAVDDYIIGKTSLSLDKIENIKRAKENAAYDALLPGEAAEEIADPDPIDEMALEQVEATYLEAAVKELKERERQVLQLRYGLADETPQTLEGVGRLLNVTRERIRQIENDSLKKLKRLPAAQRFNGREIIQTVERRRPVIYSEDPRERAIARRLGFRTLGALLSDSDVEQEIRRLSPIYVYKDLARIIQKYGSSA